MAKEYAPGRAYKDQRIVEAIENPEKGVNLENKFRNTGKKLRILRDVCEYKGLTQARGSFRRFEEMNLEEPFDAAQIHNALVHDYEAARKRLEKHLPAYIASRK